MRAFLQQFDLSGKIILLSAVIAVLSLFFTWVSIDPVANGFKQGAYIMLFVFIYPVLKIVLHKKLNKKFGYFFAILGALLSFSYISMHIIEYEGEVLKVYGYGPLVFMISCLVLTFGIWKYKVKEE